MAGLPAPPRPEVAVAGMAGEFLLLQQPTDQLLALVSMADTIAVANVHHQRAAQGLEEPSDAAALQLGYGVHSCCCCCCWPQDNHQGASTAVQAS